MKKLLFFILCFSLFSCSKNCENNGRIIGKKIFFGEYKNDTIKRYIGMYEVIIDCVNHSQEIGSLDTSQRLGDLFHY